MGRKAECGKRPQLAYGRLRRWLRSHSAIAGTPFDELEPGLTPEEAFRIRAALLRRRVRRDGAAASVPPLVFGADLQESVLTTPSGALPASDRFLARVALAMLAAPRILAVDDVAQLRHPGDQDRAWAALLRIAHSGCCVIAATTHDAAVPGGIARVALRSEETAGVAS